MTTVSERLVAFVRAQLEAGVPEDVRHEAKRLLLNQLKASVGATDHPAIDILHSWNSPGPSAGPSVGPSAGASVGPSVGPTAHVLWLGTETTPEHAAMVNGALFEVLDFHDTYIPTFLHAVSAVLPAAMAAAEAGEHSGDTLLTALALGIEVELAIATILMPTGYYRGFVPLGLVGGVGAAVACSILGGLDDEQMVNALGLAMCTAGGTYESVGSMGLAWITALSARNGLNAYQLAKRGLDAPKTAFEGDKGMLASYSDEPAAKIDGVLSALGTNWRIFGQSYKTMPTETITHAPVECTLAIHARTGPKEIKRIRFGVQPIVVTIADERFERFGLPSSELEARFDLRYCAAAAWIRGRFTLAEMREPAYTDPEILALRDLVELVADQARGSFDGCWLEIEFADGTTESITIDWFKGTPQNPLTDDELSALFRSAAADVLSAEQIEAALCSVWKLESPDRFATVMTDLRHR